MSAIHVLHRRDTLNRATTEFITITWQKNSCTYHTVNTKQLFKKYDTVFLNVSSRRHSARAFTSAEHNYEILWLIDQLVNGTTQK